MKRALLITVFAALSVAILAQAPQGFNYQAIARNIDGSVVSASELTVRIGIMKDSELVWQEDHTVQTNELGLFTLIIGDESAGKTGGSAVTFSSIPWGTGSFELDVQVDKGSGFVEMGAAPMMSVPFALYAQNGPAGPQGLQGPQGIPGEQGPKGDPGTGLVNQGLWVSGTTYNPGDYVFDRSADEPLINSMWIFQGAASAVSEISPFEDLDNWVEFYAPQGPEGPAGPQGPQGIQGIPGGGGLDEQTLALSGTMLSISNGNEVDLLPALEGFEDNDGDPTNELQDLQYTNGVLSISKDPTPTGINLPLLVKTEQSWNQSGDTIYTESSVGIGTSNTNNTLLAVQSKDPQVEKPLFEVRNDLGNPVFAVYNDGVMVYVDEDKKGVKGGFAVGGYNTASKGVTQEYLRITPDSVRIYVPEQTIGGTGARGGFTVGGYNTASNVITQEYLSIMPDSVRIYVPDQIPGAKGVKGGFAVGGYNTAAKGSTFNYLEVTSSETTVLFDTSTQAKGVKGGFAVGGYNTASKSGVSQLMSLTPENYLIGQDAGLSLTSGLYNSFIGYQSGISNTTGSENIFIGRLSGFSNIGAIENTFIGNSAGYNTTSGYGNVYIGNQAGYESVWGYYNTFVGYQAGYRNVSFYNSFYGYQSGYNNTTGKNNLAMGWRAGYGDATGMTGSENIFLGSSTGYRTTSGGRNIFLGLGSGYNNTTGSNNIFLGNASGYNTADGEFNIYFGYQSGYNSGNGVTGDPSYNTFIGYQTGYNNLTGQYNTYIGYNAGYSGASASGSNNIFIGDNTGYSNTTGRGNVFLGNLAGNSNVGGSNNVFLGTLSGQSNIGGNRNVFLGNESGRANTSGYDNVFIGNAAGRSNIDGIANVFIGQNAGYANLYGDYNTMIGFQAGNNLTGGANAWDGAYNTILGYQAGHDILKGHKNVLIGYQAGYRVRDNRYNIIIGEGAGYNLAGELGNVMSGQANLLMGLYAGSALTTGSANIFLGLDVGYSCAPDAVDNVWIGLGAGRSSASSGSVFLGKYAGYNEDSDNKLVIQTDYAGTDNLNYALVYGDFSTKYFRHNGYVGVNSTGNSLWALTVGMDANDTYGLVVYGPTYCTSGTWSGSDVNLKKNVTTYEGALQKVLSLRAVSFNWRSDEFPDRHYETSSQVGVIAQEVEEVIPEIVNTGPEGYKSVDYSKISAVLIEAIKEQQKQIEALEQRIAELEAK